MTLNSLNRAGSSAKSALAARASTPSRKPVSFANAARVASVAIALFLSPLAVKRDAAASGRIHMPPLLQLRDTVLTLGGAPLLDGAELSISAGDRIAVVGRNGSGKSTLFRIAAGQITADRGSRFVQPSARLAYLPQEPDMSGFATTLDYVLAGLSEFDDPYAARAMMAELGVDPDADPSRLSGGEARRAALVRILSPEPEILLLDEPTNHLDLVAIEWLEARLADSRSALALISHDKRLLADLTRATIWLDRGRTRRLDQGFGAFEAWRDVKLEEEELERHKLDRKIVNEEHWMRYGVTARRKRNMRRVGELADLRRERREALRSVGVAAMIAQDAKASGALVIDAERISKALWRSRNRARLFAPRHAPRPDRRRRRQRRRQDDARQPSDRRSRARLGLGAPRRECHDGRSRSAARVARADDDARRCADRRRQRQRDDQRRAAPCHGLHARLPVPARAGPNADRQIVRRRARAADARQGSGASRPT